MNTTLRNFLAVSVMVASTAMTVRIANAQQPAQPQPAPQAPAAAPQDPANTPDVPGAETGAPTMDDVQKDALPADQGSQAQQPYDQQTMGPRTATAESFEQALSPHGSWVVLAGYGRVWVPSRAAVGADFRPYAAGHWVNTEYGWTWVSDYSWGWAPFHYGRWIVDGTYGYAWVPGYTWSPAWVTWRYGAGYVGWAPYGWRAGWGYSPWVFVGNRYFLSTRLGAYVIGPSYIGTFWGRTAFIGGWRTYGGVRFFGGPSIGLVRGWVGRPIATVGIRSLGVRSGYGVRGTFGARAGFRTNVSVNTRAGFSARSNSGHTGVYSRSAVGNRGGYTNHGPASRGGYSGSHGNISRPTYNPSASRSVSRGNVGGGRRR